MKVIWVILMLMYIGNAQDTTQDTNVDSLLRRHQIETTYEDSCYHRMWYGLSDDSLILMVHHVWYDDFGIEITHTFQYAFTPMYYRYDMRKWADIDSVYKKKMSIGLRDMYRQGQKNPTLNSNVKLGVACFIVGVLGGYWLAQWARSQRNWEKSEDARNKP